MKFVISIILACLWTWFAIYVAQRWIDDLTDIMGRFLALWSIIFIAFVPGFMNAFMTSSLLLDQRPPRVRPQWYPGVSVLVAAYQEEETIAHTMRAILASDYPGPMEIIVINDGSTDLTAAKVRGEMARLAGQTTRNIRLIDLVENVGKANALNRGLAEAKFQLIATIDADSFLRPNALRHIVERMAGDPNDTAAVAGAILAGNSGQSLMAGAQQWDYFHGISAVKRMQSMYHGTLVAQGAFSLYRRSKLEEIGGWTDTVGEDIVLTWALLERGYRIGHAEDAICLTRVPETFRAFAKQRQRWARGMIEAFERHPRVLATPRLTWLFHAWNALFLPLDFTYTLIFIPGLILALFGIYWIAGPITLLVLPLAAIWNVVIYFIQKKMAKREGYRLRPKWGGLLYYLLIYTLSMQPVCAWGYLTELLGRKKKWGTK